MKYRVLLFNYLKEKKFYIAIFMINTFIVYSFYKFTVSSEAEIIYPVIITVFFLCVFLIVDFYKYVQLINGLKGGVDNCTENLRGGTFLENSIFKAIDNERVNIIGNLEDMKVKYDTREKFIITSIHKLRNNMSVMETTLEYMNLDQELIKYEVLKKDLIENGVDSHNTESVDSLKEEVQETKGILIFTCSYLGIFFLVAVSAMLLLKLIGDLDKDRERFKNINKIGLKKKEGKKIITRELLPLFFIGIFLGGVIGIAITIFLVKSDGSTPIKEFIKGNISVIGFYFIFQCCYLIYAKNKYYDMLN